MGDGDFNIEDDRGEDEDGNKQTTKTTRARTAVPGWAARLACRIELVIEDQIELQTCPDCSGEV